MFDFFLNLPRYQKRIFSVIADSLCIPLALWLSICVRLEKFYIPENNLVLFSFGITIVVTIAVFIRLGLYRAVIRYLSNHALIAVVSGVSVSALVFSASSFLLKAPVPRSAPFIYWGLALLFVGGSRMLVRSYVHQTQRKLKEKVIIYGAGTSGIQLANALFQGQEFQPVAYVDDDKTRQGSIFQGLRVHSPAALSKLIEKYGVNKLLLAIGSAPHSQRSLILRYLEPLPIKVQTIPNMADVVSGRAKIEEIKDIEIEDLLGRDPIAPSDQLLDDYIKNKVVMVTGAGGSIGSELCRQIVQHKPKSLVLFELSEFNLYAIHNELLTLVNELGLDVDLKPVMGSVQKEHRLEVIMKSFGVQTVYHAAAYKHVPLVEHNVVEGVRNNVFGTWYTAEAAIKAKVETFVLISTDKAVRPTNVMGASKRMAELVLQGLSQRQNNTRFCMVRFGNVLGSSGSVVPLFRTQIKKGGPITVTHPDIIRYFMTIPEAAQLVLQAGNMGQGGDVFVLDMGEQVRIADLARKMVHLMGLEVKDEKNPEGNIEIAYTGLRPGEKLYEELLIGDDPQGTDHPRIMKARELSLSWEEVEEILGRLDRACHIFDCDTVREILESTPLGFTPNNELEDLVWKQDKCEAAMLPDNVRKIERVELSKTAD
ncbi:nucleoside-diphosphate sugar epimerase/dehydratase [Alkalimarinus sediminis]|uniref:Polysaccharide biosynthesis protein n=1 Tax=Alkalimarinus sediminis TaxID=1632866 RepID=A0A9E8HIN3_9ALTE|nr:nucleoside-diphosphate sugar epimerase/dehydratase [Alkalimarinus sediminis]UZW73413.1 polysaccharide biosynthesis protein [Alkalimarinus sediminis]